MMNVFSKLPAAGYNYIHRRVIVISRKIICPILSSKPDLYRYYFRILKSAAPNRYTDADPLKLIWVDPEDIVYACETPFGRPLPRGKVYDGNWDQKIEKFMEQETPKKIFNYIKYGSDINSSLKSNIDTLVKKINANGYQTQKELLKLDSEMAKNKNNDPVPTIMNEVTVNIGRNGELLWRAYGKHRLAVAKTLDIEKIPVIVCARHKKWQNTRDQIISHKTKLGQNESIDLNHPDLFDLIDPNDSNRQPRDTAI